MTIIVPPVPQEGEGGEIGQGFVYSRQPHPDWVKRLREVEPKQDRHSFLWLTWEPGDPWSKFYDSTGFLRQAGQRWALYDMVPDGYAEDGLSFIPTPILTQLQGPSPREFNYYDDVLGKFVYTRPDILITQKQWELYRETGCWGSPFWTIQGENGGNKRFFTQEEKRFLQMVGLPDKPPKVGELPYAEFSERVISQVMMFNRLKEFAGNIAEFRKSQKGENYQKTLAEGEKQFRRNLVKWLADQVGEGSEVADLFLKADAMGEDATAPGDDIDWQEVQEVAEENYIETGQVSAHGIEQNVEWWKL